MTTTTRVTPQFGMKHDLFARAMRRVDPTIQLVRAEPCRTR